MNIIELCNVKMSDKKKKKSLAPEVQESYNLSEILLTYV